MKCIINARLYDFDQYISNGYILFDEQIKEVGLMKDLPIGDYEIIDVKGDLVMPGLASGHTHLYSAFARGLSVPFAPTNFQDILDQLWWPTDRSLDLEMVYYSALSIAKENLLQGVTAIIDHHASGVIEGSLSVLKKAVVDDAHLKAVFAFETSDRFDVSKCIAENNHFAQVNQKNVGSLFGAHASLSLSDETLNRIAHESNQSLHIHVAESIQDQEDSLEKYGTRVVKRLDEFNLVRKDSLFVHCLYLDDEELNILHKNQVTIAVNIGSNMNNGVGLPNISRFLAKGLNVIIGNDGLSSGITSEYLNVYYTSHLRQNSPLGLSLSQLKDLINNTYDYLSKRIKSPIGKFKTGFSSDFLVVPYKEITEVTDDNVLGHIFFGLFPNFKPKDVYIDGNIEVSNYQLTNNYLLSQEENILQSSKKAHEKILQEVHK